MARLVSPKTQPQKEGSRDREREKCGPINSKELSTLICLGSLTARRSKLLQALNLICCLGLHIQTTAEDTESSRAGTEPTQRECEQRARALPQQPPSQSRPRRRGGQEGRGRHDSLQRGTAAPRNTTPHPLFTLKYLPRAGQLRVHREGLGTARQRAAGEAWQDKGYPTGVGC